MGGECYYYRKIRKECSMKETFSVVVKKVPGGLKTQATARSFTVMMDEPLGAGGTDEAMTPVELLLSALGGCQTIFAYTFAKKHDIELEGFYVELEGDLDTDGLTGKDKNVRNGFSEIRYKMHFQTNAPFEKVEAFASFIEERCPVGDNIGNPVKLMRTGVVIDK